MDNIFLFSLFPVVILAVILLFWLTIVWLIGQLGGWKRLARHFATNHKPATGDSFQWMTLRMGFFGNYRNSVNVIVSPDGIYARPLVFFRLGHPPLFIPWQAVQHIGKSSFSLIANVQLELAAPDGSPLQAMTLYGRRVTESVRRNAPARLTGI